MIEDIDRDALVKYRINQAIETSELAAFLVNNDKLVIAVNRIYYGMYYALTALAYSRLLLSKQKDDAELVITRNGKIVKIKARELTK